MAVLVVDALEVVDVEQADGDEPLSAPRRCRELALEALLEVAVVPETGQRVGERERIALSARCVERWYSEIAASGPTSAATR